MTWITLVLFAPKRTTLPETNIAPENRVSQKETSLPTIHFRGYVSFREGKSACRFVLGELVGTASTSEKYPLKILGEPPDNNGEQAIHPWVTVAEVVWRASNRSNANLPAGRNPMMMSVVSSFPAVLVGFQMKPP